jgi:hypothetical protein
MRMLSMNAYSKDLRLKILAAIDRGIPRKEVQEPLRDLPLHHQALAEKEAPDRDLDIHLIPGRPSVKGEALRQWLPEHLERNSDLTLREHCEAFLDESGVEVSEATMSRNIARLPGEWPLKKSRP